MLPLSFRTSGVEDLGSGDAEIRGGLTIGGHDAVVRHAINLGELSRLAIDTRGRGSRECTLLLHVLTGLNTGRISA